MTTSTTTFTFTGAYLCAVGVAVWNTVGANSPVMWAVSAAMCLMPPLMMMVMAQTPAKTVAQIIRDVETETSL